MMTEVMLLFCLLVVVGAAPNREQEEMKREINVGIQILRDSLKFIENAYQTKENEAAPVTQYEDNTHFKRNLANLVFWQAVRLAPGFDEATVNANEGEKELIKIAKYLSKN